MKLPIGIDISCKTLDYHHITPTDQVVEGIIQNIQSDITNFLSQYSTKNFFLVIEPTGTYGDKLVELAHQKGFEIRLANPKKSSQFMEILGLLHKTDKNAAKALYLMGKSKELVLPVFIPQSELMKQRKQVQITLNALSKQSRMLSNQIHALEQRFSPSSLALNALKATLKTIEEQEQLLEQELQQLSDDDIEEFNRFAQSVKGIGEKSAALLMLYTGKSHKLAMVAVINKLLHQVFAVVKSKTFFDNDLYLKQNL